METTASSETAAAAGETGSRMVVGEDYNKMVQNIVDMGYEKSQVSLYGTRRTVIKSGHRN